MSERLGEIHKHLRAFIDAQRETKIMHEDMCKDFKRDHADMADALEHMGAITKSMAWDVNALRQSAATDGDYD